METYKISFKEEGLRLDKAILLFCSSLSRTRISELIEQGEIKVNNFNSKSSYKVKIDDVITLNVPEDRELEIKKEDIPLDIVYEDDDIIIINKPQGMVVHPSAGHNEHTLVNAIMNHSEKLSSINGVIRPGIVHRIDKDTSGLICVAKNDNAHNFLSEQLKDHTMARTYIALVKGIINENSGTINMPIGRDKNNRQKMAVTKENSKEAITNFSVLNRYKTNTLVECHLVTGRTHQIRVHFAAIGHPVEGDPLYYGKGFDTLYKDGQLLTAIGLTLIHPTTKKEMTFKVEMPKYFEEVIDSIK